MAAIARGVWALVDSAVGRSTVGQLLSVGVGVRRRRRRSTRGRCWRCGFPEARQIEALVRGRLGRAAR